jgi:hypothetical protein
MPGYIVVHGSCMGRVKSHAKPAIVNGTGRVVKSAEPTGHAVVVVSEYPYGRKSDICLVWRLC